MPILMKFREMIHKMFIISKPSLKDHALIKKQSVPYIWGVLAFHFNPVDTYFWTKTFFGSQEHLCVQSFLFLTKEVQFLLWPWWPFSQNKFYCANRRRSRELKSNHQKTRELGSQNFFCAKKLAI